MTINMWIATGAWLLLLAGYVFRAQKFKHVVLVLSAITIDIIMGVHLQISRSAVQTALSFSLGPLQYTHILCSSVATLLYIPTLILGFLLLTGRGTPMIKLIHIRIALTALLFRTLGFLFMFSMSPVLHLNIVRII